MDFVIGESDVQCGDGVREMVRLGRAGEDRVDDRVLQYPGERDLRHGNAALGGDLLDRIDDRAVALEVERVPEHVGLGVLLRSLSALVSPRAGIDAGVQRAPGDGADALVGQEAEHLALLLAVGEAVLVLHRR